MLVKTLKFGDRIIIGRTVVTLAELRQDSCRLGLAADRSVVIDREEIRARRDHNRRNGDGPGQGDGREGGAP